MKKQRVTLYLDPHTWRAIRLFAVGHGISASQFVENTLEQRLLDTDAYEQTKQPKSTENTDNCAVIDDHPHE